MATPGGTPYNTSSNSTSSSSNSSILSHRHSFQAATNAVTNEGKNATSPADRFRKDLKRLIETFQSIDNLPLPIKREDKAEKCHLMGLAYQETDTGNLQENSQNALTCFRAAAAAGDKTSMMLVAVYIRNGRGGADPDEEVANNIYVRMANTTPASLTQYDLMDIISRVETGGDENKRYFMGLVRAGLTVGIISLATIYTRAGQTPEAAELLTLLLSTQNILSQATNAEPEKPTHLVSQVQNFLDSLPPPPKPKLGKCLVM